MLDYCKINRLIHCGENKVCRLGVKLCIRVELYLDMH